MIELRQFLSRRNLPPLCSFSRPFQGVLGETETLTTSGSLCAASASSGNPSRTRQLPHFTAVTLPCLAPWFTLLMVKGFQNCFPVRLSALWGQRPWIHLVPVLGTGLGPKQGLRPGGNEFN